jgi:uncharacterized protein YbjQ (UPF0145 family)
MLVTTTDTLQGHRIERYLGTVFAPSVLGGVVAKRFRTGIRDISASQGSDYMKELDQANDQAMQLARERAAALGANALVGLRISFDTSGQSPPLILLCVTGTAVIALPDAGHSLDLVSSEAKPRFTLNQAGPV